MRVLLYIVCAGAIALSVAGVTVLPALVVSRLPAPLKPPPPKPSPAKLADRGVYYRFKLDLTYKGAPVHIEFVGGCGVHSSFSLASGGSTLETLAMSAFVFGARMPEGHAITVRSNPVQGGPNVCYGGLTASPSELAQAATCSEDEERGCRRLKLLVENSRFPPDWLPLITWYEHDDDFSFGIAYATQDAYASPRARFGFVSARVERATRVDFEAFERSGPRNLLPDHISDAMTHLDAPYLENMKGGIPDDILRDPRKGWRY